MAKLMQVEEVSDVTQKPEEFKARYEEVNGRKTLVVSANTETITRPSGNHRSACWYASDRRSHLNTGER